MADEKAAPIGLADILSRDAFDRDAVVALRAQALASVRDRKAMTEYAESLAEATDTASKVKRGVVLAALDRNEEALPLLEAAPAAAPARMVLAQVLERLGRAAAAATVLKAMNADAWNRMELDLALATAAAVAGQSDEALKLLKAHEGAGRDLPEYQFRIGTVLEAAGEREAAATAYEKAMDQHTEAAFRLGRLANLVGDDDLARRAYERCLGSASAYSHALFNLGILYEDLNLFEEAVDCFDRAARLEPQNSRMDMFLRDAQSSLSMYIDEDMQRRVDRRNQILDTPVSDFELSVRSRNCLQKMGVRSLGNLARCTEAELLSYKNFGETSLREIKNLLSSRGLHLGLGREEGAPAPTGEPELPVSPSADPELLSRSVDELELSVRGRACLERLQIQTLGDLTRLSENELLSCKNFGQTSLKEIKQKLVEMGLSLKENEV